MKALGGNSVYVAIAGEVVNRRSVLLRNIVLTGEESASNPLLHIHAKRWRGSLIREIRKLIHEAVPEIVEEWKWNSPVFSYKGKMICSSSAFKNHVGLNFFNGAFLEDPIGFFPKDSQAKQMRTVKFTKEDS
ncbi:DUF1801 domain-containing protein, partial [Gelidibacter sp.]|uniref:DUF1801 domain-containing protein n=1 Tax=Gelidibacter sp. TaxID=2018083 RepID=UPI002C980182